MKENDLKIRKNVIRETFKDNRIIVSSVNVEELNISKEIHQGGDIFITSNGEFIDLEFQLHDFTEDELAKYVGLAENLYEKFKSRVSVYIICPRDINVYANEREIRSDADFTIKLACIQEDPRKIILNGIMAKIKANEKLDEEDFFALMYLLKDIADRRELNADGNIFH